MFTSASSATGGPRDDRVERLHDRQRVSKDVPDELVKVAIANAREQ